MDKRLNIGQVAKEVGLPAKTIRYYEEAGIFKPLKREDNQYRVFSNEDIRRLRLIKEIRLLGIPLKEVKEIVGRCTEKGCKDAEEYVETQLPQYISSIDKKIEELKALKKQLALIRNNFKKISVK